MIYFYLIIISIPFMSIFYLFADDYTMLMGGEDFKPAVLTMKILSPLILVVGIAYFVGYLVLYPQGKEKIYTIATVFSAVLSVVCNKFMIPIYYQNGTAAVALFSEILGVIVMFWFGKEQLKEIKFFSKSFYQYIISAIFLFFITILFRNYLEINSLFLKVIIETAIALILFFGFLFLLGENVTKEVFYMIKIKLLKK